MSRPRDDDPTFWETAVNAIGASSCSHKDCFQIDRQKAAALVGEDDFDEESAASLLTWPTRVHAKAQPCILIGNHHVQYSPLIGGTDPEIWGRECSVGLAKLGVKLWTCDCPNHQRLSPSASWKRILHSYGAWNSLGEFSHRGKVVSARSNLTRALL